MSENAYRETLAALKSQLKVVDQKREKILHAISAIEDLLSFSPSPTTPTKFSEGPGQPPTYSEAVEKILMEHGKPLHVLNIIKNALDRGWYPDRNLGDRGFRNALVGSLDRKARAGDTFTKPSPATYGLKVWE